MDYLPLLMAFSGISLSSDLQNSEITEAITKIESKIMEQASLLLEKETLTTEEIFALHMCRSVACEIKRREISKNQQEEKEKELKKCISNLSDSYGFNSGVS